MMTLEQLFQLLLLILLVIIGIISSILKKRAGGSGGTGGQEPRKTLPELFGLPNVEPPSPDQGRSAETAEGPIERVREEAPREEPPKSEEVEKPLPLQQLVPSRPEAVEGQEGRQREMLFSRLPIVFDSQSVRRGIIFYEILGPCKANRSPHQDFV